MSTIGNVQRASATAHPLPDDSASAFITDPPYYDAVPYADLSDFFYVWLKRSIGHLHPTLFRDVTTPKELEVVQLAERNKLYAYKTRENFERLMAQALSEGRRVTVPSGIGVVVFAHKTTQAWETMLQAVIDSGWIVVASWPIDTERQGRLRAMDSAALASSVHLVCRPREHPDGSVRTDEIGDWRDVLAELPRRIHDWMPHLAAEGVVGADAIFACLGPALEIFSRYSRVEKVSGEIVSLKEYLEEVWAAVAKEALSSVLRDVDAGSLEPDARLSVLWLWTLGGGVQEELEAGDVTNSGDTDEGDDGAVKMGGGFLLEYDAARKIAQGLGANLEALEHIDLGLVHSDGNYVDFVIRRLKQDDIVSDSVTPNFLARCWPPALPEWSTKSVRDMFYASPKFPRLLRTDVVKDTISRGLEHGLIAYVGRASDGSYLPFVYKTSLASAQIDISDDLFIITKEAADEYVARGSTPVPAPVSPGHPTATRAGEPGPTSSGVTQAGAARPHPDSTPPPSSEIAGFTWTGEVSPQKWMNFYTKVLSRFATAGGLRLTVTVEVAPPGGVATTKAEETKVALRELGLDETLTMKDEKPR